MDESFGLGVGPRSREEEQYLLSKGLLVEDSNGDYRDMSTIIDVSDEESFCEKRNYSLPYVGIEHVNSGDFNDDSCDDKENIQPPLPSDNSYNEQIEKNLMDSSLQKRSHVVEESKNENHHGVLKECTVAVQVDQGILEECTVKVTAHHEIQEEYPVEAQACLEIEAESSAEVPEHKKITVECLVETPMHQEIAVECSVVVPAHQEIALECSVEVPAHQEIALECSIEVPAHQEIPEECEVEFPAHQVTQEECAVEVPAHQVTQEERAVEVPAHLGTQEECAVEVPAHLGTQEECAVEVPAHLGTQEECAVEVPAHQGLKQEGEVETQIREEERKEVSVHEVILEERKNEMDIEQEKPNVDEGDQGILEENLEFEVSSLSISGVNNRSFTISVHESDAYEMSYLAQTGDEQVMLEESNDKVQNEQHILEEYNDSSQDEQKVQDIQEENAEFEENPLSVSEVNNRSFTISVHDSDALETSGKSGIYNGIINPTLNQDRGQSSGDMDDTMTAIEKLLLLAAEQEESEMNAEQNSIFETSIPPSQFPANSSDLISLEEVEPITVSVDQNNLMETPVEPFLPEKVTSSTVSRHVETPKSRENKIGRKKSENLMYFSPAPLLVPKRILDLKKKGKFFSPSPPRPLPNAVPPRGIRPMKEEVQNENMLTPVQFCGRVLKCASSEKKEKKKTYSTNNLYADVNSPVKEYIYGRATPSSLLKSKSSNNIIRSLPAPQQKLGQGFRPSEVSSITRIPKPKSSISSSSKLRIVRTSFSANTTKGKLENNCVKSHPLSQSGIPKSKFKNEGVVFEGCSKQRVHNEDDETLSSSQICEFALRHTGLRNESGNASLLLGNRLTKQFYPTTPSATPISTNNINKRNV